jgi:glutamate synthase (NADPH/NADH) large chain
MTKDGRFRERCNMAMVDVEAVEADGAEAENSTGAPAQRASNVHDFGMGDMLYHSQDRLRILLERHALHTGSKRARALLDDWQAALGKFVKVMPKDYRRALKQLEAERLAAADVAAE